MDTIEQIISSLQISEPIGHKNLSVMFLSRPDQQEITCLNWDEALLLKVLEVSEIDGGVVSELKFYNSSLVPIFIPEGVSFMGLKQSRALRVSSLIGSREELILPVHCVEASRWSSQTVYAQGSPYCLYSRLRALNLLHAGESLRNREGYESHGSQGESWENIRRVKQQRERQTGRHIQSPGEYVGDIYKSENETVEDFISNLPCPDDAIGFITELDGHIVGLELFGSPKLFARNYGSVLAGFSLEATDDDFRQELSHRETLSVEAFLKQIESVHKEHFRAIGNGVDVRFETGNMVGAALVNDNDGVLYHLEAFAL